MSKSELSRLTQADTLFADAIANLEPGKIAIDCGANVGKYTLEMARTGADVFAFEPDELVLPNIGRRVDDYENVQVINAAVGIKSGSINLYRSKNYHNNQARESKNNTTMSADQVFSNPKMSETFEDGEMATVELVDLPKFINEKLKSYGCISLLKVDIEGAEVELMEEMLAQRLFDKIDLTVIETHEFLFPDLKDRYSSIRKALREVYPPEVVNFDWR